MALLQLFKKNLRILVPILRLLQYQFHRQLNPLLLQPDDIPEITVLYPVGPQGQGDYLVGQGCFRMAAKLR